jgi:hypothetical protein
LLIESAIDDPIFPLAEAKQACQEVAKAYALLGVPERFDQDVFPGGHRFNGKKAFMWLTTMFST